MVRVLRISPTMRLRHERARDARHGAEGSARRCLKPRVGRAHCDSGTLSISSARTEMEFVPAVSFRVAPPVASSVPVLTLNSERPEEPALWTSTVVDGCTRNSAIVLPPALSRYSFPAGACLWASAAKLMPATATATVIAYLFFMFFSFMCYGGMFAW